MMKHLEAASIPMLLFSAGIGNVIEAFLRHQLGSIPENIHIISNMLSFNEKVQFPYCFKFFTDHGFFGFRVVSLLVPSP